MEEIVKIMLIIFTFAIVVSLAEYIYIVYIVPKRNKNNNQDVIYRMDPITKDKNGIKHEKKSKKKC